MANATLEIPTQVELARFVSHWAHDLRSPFNHILGFTKIVLNGQDGPLTDLQKEDLTTAYNSSLRALSLVNNLIDIARLIEKEKEINLVELGVAQTVEQSVYQWKKFNPLKEIQVENLIEPGTSPILADEAQFRQTISSLMAYVTEFVEKPAKISLQGSVEPKVFVITIQSNGQKSRHQSAFDLEMYGFISRALIELQGGVLRSQEETANGALVTFAMPFA